MFNNVISSGILQSQSVFSTKGWSHGLPRPFNLLKNSSMTLNKTSRNTTPSPLIFIYLLWEKLCMYCLVKFSDVILILDK